MPTMCAALLALLAGLLTPLIASTSPAQASPRSWIQPAGFTSDDLGFDDGVTAVAGGSDGTTYLGGDFTKVGRVTGVGAAFTADSGHAVATYPQVGGTSSGNQVFASVPDGSGGWFIGGTFTRVGGVTVKNLARVGDFAVWDWAPVLDGDVNALAISGNTLYVGGSFTSVTLDGAASTRGRLAAFDITTGDLLPWAPFFDDAVTGLAISGGRIYVSGSFANVTPVGGGLAARTRLAAISADDTGTLLPWAPSANNVPRVLAAAGGRIYAGGNFTSITPSGGGPTTRNCIAAIAADDTGTLLPWAPFVNSEVLTMSVASAQGSQPERVVVGGAFTSVTPVNGGSTPRWYLAAIVADDTGSLSPWAPRLDSWAWSSTVRGSDLLVGGWFTAVTPQGGSPVPRTRMAAFALDDTGTLRSWDPGATNTVHALASAGSRVYAGGTFGVSGLFAERRGLAAVDIGGSLTAWSPRVARSPTLQGSVKAMRVEGDRVYVGGDFAEAAGTSGALTARAYVAAFSASPGGDVLGWAPEPNDTVWDLVVKSGVLYLGGDFTTVKGQGRARLAAVLMDDTGTLTSWNPGSGGSVYALAVRDDSIIAAGNFTQAAGQTRNRLAAFGTDGSLSGWSPSANREVQSLAVSDNVLYLGGKFEQINGTTRGGLGAVRLDDTGSLLAWAPALRPSRSDVLALAVSNGRLTVGGAFTSVIPVGGSSQSQPYLASVLTDDTGTLVSGAPAASRQVDVATYAGGRLILGGGSLLGLVGTNLVGSVAFGPGVPTSVSGVAGDTQVSLNWASPAWAGTLAVAGYRIEASTDHGTTWSTAMADTGSTATSATLTGLVNGTAYVFRVSAINAIASSEASTPSAAVTPSVPVPPPPPVYPASAPLDVLATAGDALAAVTWTAPASSGSFPVTSYRVTARPGGQSCLSSTLTCTVAGLTNGTTYTFTVSALNGAGWGADSLPSNAVIPTRTPDPATITLTISGSRSGRTLDVVGTSTGLGEGAVIKPWLRIAGRDAVQGRDVRVGADGSFAWSRRVPSTSAIRGWVTHRDISSNVVRIAGGRS